MFTTASDHAIIGIVSHIKIYSNILRIIYSLPVRVRLSVD